MIGGYEPDRYLVLYDFADYVRVKEQLLRTTARTILHEVSRQPCERGEVLCGSFGYRLRKTHLAFDLTIKFLRPRENFARAQLY